MKKSNDIESKNLNDKEKKDYIRQRFGKRKFNSINKTNNEKTDSATDFFERRNKHSKNFNTELIDILKKEQEKEKEIEIKKGKEKEIEIKREKEKNEIKQINKNNKKDITKLSEKDITNIIEISEKDKENKTYEITDVDIINDNEEDNNIQNENSINDEKSILIIDDDKPINIDEEINSNLCNDIKNKIDSSLNLLTDLQQDIQMVSSIASIDTQWKEKADSKDIDNSTNIKITFNGYKMIKEQVFVRIYPLTIYVPVTADFKTIFKIYCKGTNLNENEIMFSYKNIEIFSTSTLKGLKMTSATENYNIDVFYKTEYPTYKYQVKTKLEEEILELKQERSKKEQMEVNFVNEEDILKDAKITIIIRESRDNEVKLSVKKSDNLGVVSDLYIQKCGIKKKKSKFVFTFDGEVLSNQQTLDDIGIDEDDIIDLKIT